MATGSMRKTVATGHPGICLPPEEEGRKISTGNAEGAADSVGQPDFRAPLVPRVTPKVAVRNYPR